MHLHPQEACCCENSTSQSKKHIASCGDKEQGKAKPTSNFLFLAILFPFHLPSSWLLGTKAIPSIRRNSTRRNRGLLLSRLLSGGKALQCSTNTPSRIFLASHFFFQVGIVLLYTILQTISQPAKHRPTPLEEAPSHLHGLYAAAADSLRHPCPASEKGGTASLHARQTLFFMLVARFLLYSK